MATSPTASSLGSSSSATFPTMCTPGRPILEPNASNLSKLSYSSSSFMSRSSYSAPSSPSNPNSSVLNIPSPPRSPCSTAQETLDSPRGNFSESPPFTGSLQSRSDPSSQSPAKNPKLSLLHVSPLPSLPLAPLEQEDLSPNDSGPSNITTPYQPPFVVHTSSSTLVCSSSLPKSCAPSSPLANPQPSAPGPSLLSCELTVLSVAQAIPGLPSQSSHSGSSSWNAEQSSAPTSPSGSIIIKDSPSPHASPKSNYWQSPKSVPGVDTPLCSHFYSQISSSAQFDLDAQSTLPGNLDYEDGIHVEVSTLSEPQERPLGSLVLNAQKSQAASTDLNEGERQPSFHHNKVKINRANE